MTTIGATAAIGPREASAVAPRVRSAARDVNAKTPEPRRVTSDDDSSSSPSPVLPPPQDLPVLGLECAEDRLQGYAPSIALHLGARQDRALAHHRRLREETA